MLILFPRAICHCLSYHITCLPIARYLVYLLTVQDQFRTTKETVCKWGNKLCPFRYKIQTVYHHSRKTRYNSVSDLSAGSFLCLVENKEGDELRSRLWECKRNILFNMKFACFWFDCTGIFTCWHFATKDS